MNDIGAEHGQVDCVGVAFPAGKANLAGEVASESAALVKRNTVRVLDLLLVR
jgi:hypothetical protein